jgi:hypothetical protein
MDRRRPTPVRGKGKEVSRVKRMDAAKGPIIGYLGITPLHE